MALTCPTFLRLAARPFTEVLREAAVPRTWPPLSRPARDKWQPAQVRDGPDDVLRQGEGKRPAVYGVPPGPGQAEEGRPESDVRPLDTDCPAARDN